MEPSGAIQHIERHRPANDQGWWVFVFTPNRAVAEQLFSSSGVLPVAVHETGLGYLDMALSACTDGDSWVSGWPTNDTDHRWVTDAEIGWFRLNARKSALLKGLSGGRFFVLPSCLRPIVIRAAPRLWEDKACEIVLFGEESPKTPATPIDELLEQLVHRGLAHLGTHTLCPPYPKARCTYAHADVLIATRQLLPAREVNARALAIHRGTRQEPALWQQAATIHRHLEEFDAATIFASVSHRLLMASTEDPTPDNLAARGASWMFLQDHTPHDTTQKAIWNFQKASTQTGKAEHQGAWAKASIQAAKRRWKEDPDLALTLANDAAELERTIRETDQPSVTWLRVEQRQLRGRSASRTGDLAEGQRLQQLALMEAFETYQRDPLHGPSAEAWSAHWRSVTPESLSVPHPDDPKTIIELATAITRNIGLGLDREIAMRDIGKLEPLVRHHQQSTDDLRILCTAFRIGDEC